MNLCKIFGRTCPRLSVFIVIGGLSLIASLKCGDDAVTITDTQFCVSGKISNWTRGTKTLQARFYGESHTRYEIVNGPIDAEGNFNLCLPLTMPDTSLMRADSIFYSGCSGGTATFNPPDARGGEIYDFRVKSGDTVIGFVKRNNYDTLYPGAFSIMYVYANQSVTGTGWKYCSPDTLNFNGTANTGWTKVTKNCTRTIGTGTTYLYNTTEPAGAVWKFSPVTDALIDEGDGNGR